MLLQSDNIDEVWVDLLTALRMEGDELDSRAGGCRELLEVSVQLTNVQSTWLSNERRNLSQRYGAAELLWYLSGSDDVNLLTPYAPSYSRFATPGTNSAHGAYGKRWTDDLSFKYAQVDQRCRRHNQLVAVIDLLKRDPNTRQALIGMWNAGDLIYALKGECPDIPCTVGMQFHLRDGVLHASTRMRSNDAWLGFPYDVFCFTYIQKLVAAELGVPTGWYNHSVGSMHLYDKHWPQSFEACEAEAPGVHLNESGGLKEADLAIGQFMQTNTEPPEEGYLEAQLLEWIDADR